MHVDQGLCRRLLNDVVGSLDGDQMAFINGYMDDCWDASGQPRPRTCPPGGLKALSVWITCAEYVGLARAIVVPLAAILPSKAEGMAGDPAPSSCTYAAASSTSLQAHNESMSLHQVATMLLHPQQDSKPITTADCLAVSWDQLALSSDMPDTLHMSCAGIKSA